MVFDIFLSFLYDVFYTFVFEIFPALFLSDLGISWIGSVIVIGVSLLVAHVSIVVVIS